VPGGGAVAARTPKQSNLAPRIKWELDKFVAAANGRDIEYRCPSLPAKKSLPEPPELNRDALAGKEEDIAGRRATRGKRTCTTVRKDD